MEICFNFFSSIRTDSPNPCSPDNGGCSHLCLLSVSTNSNMSCSCPVGLEFDSDDDDLNCVEGENITS